jgi:uncharacterized lipoprotein YajG
MKMKNLTIRFLTLSVVLTGVFLLTNCDKTTPSTTTANSNTATVTTNKPSDASKTQTASTDSVGVPECDDYIKKYEACLTKVAKQAPQIEPNLKSAFQQQRDGFKQAAANPQSKAMLATQCKQAVETAKQSTSAYTCEW